MLTEDVICVKDWLCETGNEKYYNTIGSLVKSRLAEKKIKSTFVGDLADIDFNRHIFHKKPINYNDLFLDNFNKCIEEEVSGIKHTPTRNRKIDDCLRDSFIKTENLIRLNEEYIVKPDGRMTFKIPPRNSLPSSISEWCDKNNVTIITSNINPMYEPKTTTKKVIPKIKYERTCTKKNFNVCAFEIADEIARVVNRRIK